VVWESFEFSSGALDDNNIFIDEDGVEINFQDFEDVDLKVEGNIDSRIKINSSSNLDPIIIPGV